MSTRCPNTSLLFLSWDRAAVHTAPNWRCARAQAARYRPNIKKRTAWPTLISVAHAHLTAPPTTPFTSSRTASPLQELRQDAPKEVRELVQHHADLCPLARSGGSINIPLCHAACNPHTSHALASLLAEGSAGILLEWQRSATIRTPPPPFPNQTQHLEVVRLTASFVFRSLLACLVYGGKVQRVCAWNGNRTENVNCSSHSRTDDAVTGPRHASYTSTSTVTLSHVMPPPVRMAAPAVLWV